MTELEAVNTLLSIIGEAPIDSLADTSVNEITDSALARRTLNEVSRDVQAEGWAWNTEREVTLTKNSNDQFLLTSDMLHVHFSPTRYTDKDLVARGLKVRDRLNNTSTFASDTTLIADEVVYQLDWDELPHAAQQYITIRAGRIYANRFVNSSPVYVYTVEDEEYARAMLMRSEERGRKNNILWGSDNLTSPHRTYQPAMGLRYRRN